MKSQTFIISFLIFCLTVTLSLARTWTMGSRTIEGEYLGLTDDGTKVRIRKNDGKRVKVTLSKLSREDQNYVSDMENPFEEIPEEEPASEIPKSNWYAFIVGVNTYTDDDLPTLPFCVNDAQSFALRLRTLGFPAGNITLLVDSSDAKVQPTWENITKRLEKMVEKLPEDSLIVFFFAGHGMEIPNRGSYILPTDCYKSLLPNRGISAMEVANLLDSSNARAKVMIVDACRDKKSRAATNSSGFDLKNPPEGLAFLQSYSSGEHSYEDKTNHHGYFTQTILEALEGKADANEDGEVTLSEIFAYTSSETETRVNKEVHVSQRPFYRFNGATIPNYALVTGLLVDGLTKAQRDEAEKLYQEAHSAFLGKDLTLAETRINAALAIYPEKELYQQEKTLIMNRVNVVREKEKKEKELTEQIAAKQKEKEAAEEEARKKDAELAKARKARQAAAIQVHYTSVVSFVWAGSEITKFIGKETEVVIPEGTSMIRYEAFKECETLTSVVIPESVTKIGDYAFWDCSSLTSVVIPDSVQKIGDGAFWGCTALKQWSISSDHSYFKTDGTGLLTKDGKTLVACLGSATEYRIPEGVTAIGKEAFSDCSSLTSVVIPEGVTRIESHAFYGCSSLTSVEIPEGVTEIGDRAFLGCSSLTSVVIPEGVTRIGSDAFRDCRSLTSVVIPEGVTKIGDWAFLGCSSLTSVVIPEGVTKIGWGTFSGCSSLMSVVIPASVMTIHWSAFHDCPKLTIHAPGGSEAEKYAQKEHIPFVPLTR